MGTKKGITMTHFYPLAMATYEVSACSLHAQAHLAHQCIRCSVSLLPASLAAASRPAILPEKGAETSAAKLDDPTPLPSSADDAPS